MAFFQSFTPLLFILLGFSLFIGTYTSEPRLIHEPTGEPGKTSHSSQIKMKLVRVGSWNRHSSFGADGFRYHSEVTVDLHPDGNTTVLDSGQLSQSHLSKRTGGLSKEIFDWKNVWSGTWKLNEKKLLLSLTCSSCKCNGLEVIYYNHNRVQAEKKKIECHPAPSRLMLNFSQSEVKLEAYLTPAEHVKKPVPVWHCSGGNELSGKSATAFPWVFNQKQCLKQISPYPPHHAYKYSLCDK